MERDLKKWAERGGKLVGSRDLSLQEYSDLLREGRSLDPEGLYNAIRTAFLAGVAVGHETRKAERK